MSALEPCSRCSHPTSIFSVDLPLPAPLCAGCCDVAAQIPLNDAAWAGFLAGFGSVVRCDCGDQELPNTTDVVVWIDDIAHAEPLCLPMPVGAR